MKQDDGGAEEVHIGGEDFTDEIDKSDEDKDSLDTDNGAEQDDSGQEIVGEGKKKELKPKFKRPRERKLGMVMGVPIYVREGGPLQPIIKREEAFSYIMELKSIFFIPSK